jgi:glycosyltransferase involved in cell wall biosynthesis
MNRNSLKEITVSTVICAHNEEKYLRETLEQVLRCPRAEEIIVVDDGSTDGTKKDAKGFGRKVNLISYRKNRGKGYAMARGIETAKGKIIVFLDAHLQNLKDKHLQKLTDPILKGKANYVLEICSGCGPGIVTDLTGQRAYLKRNLIPYLGQIKKTRYGVETCLNEIFPVQWGKRVFVPDLIHLVKYQKMPFSEALSGYLQETLEISKTKLGLNSPQYSQLKKILDPRKIKSVKALRQRVNEIKDKEVSELIEKYALPYLKKITASE